MEKDDILTRRKRVKIRVIRRNTGEGGKFSVYVEKNIYLEKEKKKNLFWGEIYPCIKNYYKS